MAPCSAIWQQLLLSVLALRSYSIKDLVIKFYEIAGGDSGECCRKLRKVQNPEKKTHNLDIAHNN